MCNQFSLTLQQFFLLHTIVWLTVYWIEPACASCKCTSRLLLDNIYTYSKFTGSVQHIHSNTSAVVDVVSYYYCLLDSTTRQNQHIPVVVGHTSQCDTSILLYHLFKQFWFLFHICLCVIEREREREKEREITKIPINNYHISLPLHYCAGSNK